MYTQSGVRALEATLRHRLVYALASWNERRVCARYVTRLVRRALASESEYVHDWHRGYFANIDLETATSNFELMFM